MKIIIDDMLLTKDTPTTAGSKMLDGYKSLFEATAVTKVRESGFEIVGKSPVGEMGIDVCGETYYKGKTTDAYALGEADAVLSFDVNGAPRRVAAQNGLVFIKPTYGIVSRFGTVSAACSGECVGVMAKNTADCKAVLSAIVGKDEKDGTMHADEVCKKAVSDTKEIKKVALIGMGIDLSEARAALTASGIEVTEVDAGVIESANAAWNILMCAELCNNVSRFDGIKYGYRTPNYKNLDELYTNSRTEAFGDLLKTAIIYGSDALSSANYMSKYDKSLRVRRVIVEALGKVLSEYDAIMLPVCSRNQYDGSESAFVENKYTAVASISGLPAVVAGGVQVIGEAFTDGALLDLAKILNKEEK